MFISQLTRLEWFPSRRIIADAKEEAIMRGVLDEVELPVCVGEPEGGLPRGAEVDVGDVDASHGDGEERRRGDGPAGSRGIDKCVRYWDKTDR